MSTRKCENDTPDRGIARTPRHLLGITAAHVWQQYKRDLKDGPLPLQLNSEVVDYLPDRILQKLEAHYEQVDGRTNRS